MAKFEQKIITVDPSDVDDVVHVFQKFWWEVLSTDTVDTTSRASHLETRGDTLYSVVTAHRTAYTKINFKRTLEHAEMDRIRSLESEYWSARGERNRLLSQLHGSTLLSDAPQILGFQWAIAPALIGLPAIAASGWMLTSGEFSSKPVCGLTCFLVGGGIAAILALTKYLKENARVQYWATNHATFVDLGGRMSRVLADNGDVLNT